MSKYHVTFTFHVKLSAENKEKARDRATFLFTDGRMPDIKVEALADDHDDDDFEDNDPHDGNEWHITPQQERRRWQILGQDGPPTGYTYEVVEGVDDASFKALLDEGFIDLDEFSDDNGPLVSEFRSFMLKYPGKFKLGVYVIPPTNENVRITINSIASCGEIDKAMMADFVKWFRLADDFNISDSYLSAGWEE